MSSSLAQKISRLDQVRSFIREYDEEYRYLFKLEDLDEGQYIRFLEVRELLEEYRVEEKNLNTEIALQESGLDAIGQVLSWPMSRRSLIRACKREQSTQIDEDEDESSPLEIRRRMMRLLLIAGPVIIGTTMLLASMPR